MSRKKLDPSVIRIGDHVRIIKPDIFVRCGYPLSKEQAVSDVSKLFGGIVEDLVFSVHNGDKFIKSDKPIFPDSGIERQCKKILSDLAYVRLMGKNFGGTKRSIYTKTEPNLIEKNARVQNIKFVQTGEYIRGYGGRGWFEDDDYYPPYLSGSKSHKILFVDVDYDSNSAWSSYGIIAIEAINVKKMRLEAI